MARLGFDDPFYVPGTPYPPFPYIYSPIVDVFDVFLMGFLFLAIGAVVAVAVMRAFELGPFAYHPPVRTAEYREVPTKPQQVLESARQAHRVEQIEAAPRISATVTDLSKRTPAPRAVTSSRPERIAGPSRKELGGSK